jgi:hypothetical protein
VKFKLDENVGLRGFEFLKAAGPEVMAVREQGLNGACDDALFVACTKECRALPWMRRRFIGSLLVAIATIVGISVDGRGRRAVGPYGVPN